MNPRLNSPPRVKARVFSLSLGKDVILSEAKNLTHDRETLRFAQGDNEKALESKQDDCKATVFDVKI